MKSITLFFLFFLSLVSCKQVPEKNGNTAVSSTNQLIDSSDMTNNFYDNTETNALPLQDLIIEGEVANPGKVDFSVLPIHSVIVKEALLDSAGGDRFVGAYRYDGYSLFDILDKRVLKKANSKEFNPIIDLYIEIENSKGEKIVFSWGELYYPNNLHKIIIATGVSRIVPSKTKDLWPLPSESKIVAATDLVTERNISSPVKITVKSFPISLVVNRNLSPLYSPKVDVYIASEKIAAIDRIPEKMNIETFNTIFYGRGKGIHSTSPFKGALLKDILIDYYPVSRENIKKGMMVLVGKDGYRCAVSYSELFNRNDQEEFLLVKTNKDEDGGLFRTFPASDFFSDRAIKALSEIHLGY
jgi:hypothetical protein